MWPKMDNDLRVAILTQPLRINYGGLLQAYALSTVLRSLGCEPIVVNRLQKTQPSLSRKIKDGIKKHLLCKYIDTLSPILFCKPDFDTLSRYTREFVEKHIPKSKDIFSTEELEAFCIDRFDAYVVGSDQVWRPKFSPCISNYFLDFLPSDQKVKKLSYAASFGVDHWEFTADETMQCKKLAQKFDAVSVREDSAIGMCKYHFCVQAEHVLDPTFLLERDDYIQLIDKDKKSSGNLFAYILNTSELKETLLDKVVANCGLEPFIVEAKSLSCQSFNNIKEYIVPPVEDWIRAFRDADFVVTDSFHGCVFSIIFQKPFFVVGNKRRGLARFRSLLSMFELEQRLVSVIDEFSDEKISEPIDWKKVGTTLEIQRNRSIRFLQENLLGRC